MGWIYKGLELARGVSVTNGATPTNLNIDIFYPYQIISSDNFSAKPF